MKLNTRFLSDEEVKKIHKDSLTILEEVGIKFPSEKALDILKENGATVDYDTQIAKIPEQLVKKALETCPKEFTLGGRVEEHDWKLPSIHTGYTLDGEGSYVIDYETREKRKSLKKDLQASLRIFEELELAAIAWPNITCADFPVNSIGPHIWATCFEATSKHIQYEVHSEAEIPFVIDIMKAILGDEKAVRERKMGSNVYCTVSPLSHEQDMLEATMLCAEYDVPIMVLPMVCPMSTGPGSMYSSIAMANAESLSSIAIFQMVAPGVPIVFGNANISLEVNSGLSLQGSPEMCLMTGSLSNMAKYYGLPSQATGLHSDAKEPGPNSIFEKMSTNLPLVLGDLDIIIGYGLNETSMSLTYEQIVVDHEIAKICKRIKEGIDCSDEKWLLDDIKKIGPSGHFLTTKASRKAPRSGEFWRPELINRQSYETWLDGGKSDIYKEAQKKVEKYLNTEQKYPLSKDTIKDLNEILERADSVL